ncbi:D-2-hydroxyacid dehydrogenase family protein [Hydrogenophaga sp.]|uniref:D-2-hydroxyacid dehydrogenase family protein n=1 Tax=Hydrogenophaga sp. TaxID=1904254 RepID=UPI002724CF7B|nr:D-2-hydroxyacid dehydrogenase family protein [Hydrogenophaga sp.]MDO8904432.1 D-2-hydroxyacid dehydrogenase family protein [Hydrogenophaga sp.]
MNQTASSSKSVAPGRLPRVVVLDDYERAFDTLADWQPVRERALLHIQTTPLKGAALVGMLGSADVVVLMRDRTPLTAELIAQLPQLKLVIFTGTRNQALDAAALASRGIPVCHTGWGPSKDSTAELTWALIMAAYKRLVENCNALMQGEEQAQWRTPHALLPMLKGETIGLVGLGEIGGRVARYAQVFGMEVLAWSPRMTVERAAEHGAAFVELDALLERSRIVSLHLVATPQTRGLINAQRLATMRPDSLLVNTSRSHLIDTAALMQALPQGRPGQVALDVFDTEPLPLDDPIRRFSQVLLSPHLGFVAKPVFETFVRDARECVLSWLAGEPLPRLLAP